MPEIKIIKTFPKRERTCLRYCSDYVVTQEEKDGGFIFRIYRKTEDGFILLGKNNGRPTGIEEYADKDMEKRLGRNWRSKVSYDDND